MAGHKMRTPYDKLVRDHIPDIIAASGKTAETRRVRGAEYRRYLEAKLDEEIAELRETGASRPEELSDVLEVVYALAGLEGVSREGLERLRREKAQRRGAFLKRLVLVAVEDDGN